MTPLNAIQAASTLITPCSVFRDRREPLRGPLGELPSNDLKWGDYAVVDGTGRIVAVVEHKSISDLFVLALHDHERRIGQEQHAKDASKAGVEHRLLVVDANEKDLFVWRKDAAKAAVKLAKVGDAVKGFNWRYSVLRVVRNILVSYASAGWTVLLESSGSEEHRCSELIRRALDAVQIGQALSEVDGFREAQKRGSRALRRHHQTSPGYIPPCTRRILSGDGLAEMKPAWGDVEPPLTTLKSIIYVVARKFLIDDPLVAEGILLEQVTGWADQQLWSRFKKPDEALIAQEVIRCSVNRKHVIKHNGCHNGPLEKLLLINPFCFPGECPFAILNGSEHNYDASKMRAIPGFMDAMDCLERYRRQCVQLDQWSKVCDDQIFVLRSGLRATALRSGRSSRTFNTHLNIAIDWGLAGAPHLFLPEGLSSIPRPLWVPTGLVPYVDPYVMSVVVHLHHVLISGNAGHFQPRTQEARLGKNHSKPTRSGRAKRQPLLPVARSGHPLGREVPWQVMLLALASRTLGAVNDDELLSKAKSYLSELSGHSRKCPRDTNWTSALKAFAEIQSQLTNSRASPWFTAT